MSINNAVDIYSVYRTALRTRAFELKLLELFSEGKLSGTVHTCVGQELCAATLHPHLIPGLDAFFATHRGHGHYLAYGGPMDALLAELMGQEGALCLGRGGSQHLRYQRYYSSGIQGSTAPVAVGFAWAMKRRGESSLTVCQIGDGTLGEGTLYEAFTLASLLQVPILFLLEYNGWAQSTDVTTTTPGDIIQRAIGFGLEVSRVKDDDPESLFSHLGQVVKKVRLGKPTLQIIETRRLMAHSKGDDNRPPELVEKLWQSDPLVRLLKNDSRAQAMLEEAKQEVEDVVRDTCRRPVIEYSRDSALPVGERSLSSLEIHTDFGDHSEYNRVVQELNRALHDMMSSNKEVILIGEDLLDPYGGAFKVSRGLSSNYPDQVFSTPIAEAGIIGLSNGLALAGMRPVAEIMFSDFATLATDQIINSAAKFHYMYGGQVKCPITVRLASGAGRGYGPTHSQSLELLFCGIPGLRVVALSLRHHPGRLLTHAVLQDDSPTIFVENKLLYAKWPASEPPVDLSIKMTQGSNGNYPPLSYVPVDNGQPDVTVVTYGRMTAIVEEAMHCLIFEEELRFDYVILTQLWPLDTDEITESVKRSGRLIVIEENVPDFGLGAAIIARVTQQTSGGFACRAIGCHPVPIPCARHLEDMILPSVDTVISTMRAVISEEV